MKRSSGRFSALSPICLAGLLAVIAAGAIAADLPMRPQPLVPQPVAAPAPVFQHCTGPATLLQPNQTVPLTCNVVSSIGGASLFVVPEMWIPGNGCIATADKPRVVMVGNSFGVSATLINRCGSPYMGTEGGLGWFIYSVM
jgi:hypothetical protein